MPRHKPPEPRSSSELRFAKTKLDVKALAHSEGVARAAKTAKLKALRLEKEAVDQVAAALAPNAKGRGPRPR